jgi:hypothetical protein
MGKYGWVTSHFEPGDSPPLAILCGWIDESYRAIAPKRLVAALDGAPAPTTKQKRKKKVARAATKKKAKKAR